MSYTIFMSYNIILLYAISIAFVWLMLAWAMMSIKRSRAFSNRVSIGTSRGGERELRLEAGSEPERGGGMLMRRERASEREGGGSAADNRYEVVHISRQNIYIT